MCNVVSARQTPYSKGQAETCFVVFNKHIPWCAGDRQRDKDTAGNLVTSGKLESVQLLPADRCIPECVRVSPVPVQSFLEW